MKKQLLLKIVALITVNVMIISLGLTTLAANNESAETYVTPRWSTLSMCAYLFDKDQVLEDYDIFACGGSTSVPLHYYAYVKVELQYLNRNGNWINFDSWEDQGHMEAVVEKYIQVMPGYSYRLLLTHKALDGNGNVIETFYDEPDYYLTSASR